MEKYLYCPKCKTRPDKIIEKYLSPIEEERSWDGECYELERSNFEDVESIELCGKCRTELQEITEK